MTIHRAFGVLLAALFTGCVFTFGSPDPDEPIDETPIEDIPIEVVVDNDLDEAVLVRIDARRLGEATSVGRTILSTRRISIARRAVTVCVRAQRSSRTLCHPGRLLVPGSVTEIWIRVRRNGRVSATVL